MRTPFARAEPLEQRALFSIEVLGGIYGNHVGDQVGPVVSAGKIYLIGYDKQHGEELWQSDGTKAGTGLIQDMTIGKASTKIDAIFAFKGGVCFSALAIINGQGVEQLWWTDGSAANTQLLASNAAISPTPAIIGDTLYFQTDQATFWKSDGTSSGTTSVDVPALDNAVITNLSTFDGQLYFIASLPHDLAYPDNGERDPWLYRSDGTANGTAAVHKFNYITDDYGLIPPFNLVPAGDRLYFLSPTSADSPASELWSTTGTDLSTKPLVLPALKQPKNHVPVLRGNLWNVADRLVFAIDAASNHSLWSTDGTAAGTAHLAEIETQYGSIPDDFFELVDGQLHFNQDGDTAVAWQTDGTVAGTKQIGPPDHAFFARAGNNLFLWGGSDETTSTTLWNRPAHSKTLIPVTSYYQVNGAHPVVLNGQVYFLGADTNRFHTGLLRLDPTHGTVTGFGFLDLNEDGVRGNEPGLAGATVYADSNLNGLLDVGEVSALLDQDGRYELDGVALGPADIRVIRPDSTYHATTPIVKRVNVIADPPVTFNFAMMTSAATATIQGTVFRQSLAGTNQSAVAGVDIFLDLNGDGAQNGSEPVSTSDINGHYQFTGLVARHYWVRSIAANGWAPAYPKGKNVMAMPNQSATCNVAELLLHHVHGVAFDDLNANGQRDNNEPALPGGRVQLSVHPSGGSDEPPATTITAAQDGSYEFFVPLDGGYTVTAPSTGGRRPTNSNSEVADEGGETTFDIGSTSTALISGVVCHDDNADGQLDGDETPATGWQVFLDTNANGQLDVGESSLAADAQGNYSFDLLPAGTYHVTVIRANPKLFATTPTSYTIKLGSSGTFQGNFGFARKSKCYGTVFNDLDEDGSQSSNEPGLAGLRVFVDRNNNQLLDSNEFSGVSDAKGNFNFTVLGTGPATMNVVVGTGWGITFWDSPWASLGSGYPARVPVLRVAQIQFRVFNDANSNGKRDANESFDASLLAASDFFLDTNHNGKWDADDEEGFHGKDAWAFPSLDPGTYRITMTTRRGWRITTPTTAQYTVKLSRGQVFTADFGVATHLQGV